VVNEKTRNILNSKSKDLNASMGAENQLSGRLAASAAQKREYKQTGGKPDVN
jgi:hypothetical protein